MVQSTGDASRGRQEGLDLLRFGAILLVTAQHAMSLAGYGSWTSFHSFNLGQFGVAIFLGISAVLAAESSRPAVSWILQRFGRLYPAYWVTMILCFVLAWASSYRTFDGLQVLSQMLGLGLFTHEMNLVNGPTWFISLLLLCYAAFFAAKLAKRVLLTNVLLLALVATWIVWKGGRWPWIHLLTFFLASTLALALPRKHREWVFVAVGVLLLLGSPHSVAFAYTGVTLGVMGVSSCVTSSSPLVRTISKYSYEYYLIHGPCLVGMMRLFQNNTVLGILSGLSLAAATSVLLHHAVSRITGRMSRCFAGAREFFRGAQPGSGSGKIRKQQDAAHGPVEAG